MIGNKSPDYKRSTDINENFVQNLKSLFLTIKSRNLCMKNPVCICLPKGGDMMPKKSYMYSKVILKKITHEVAHY